MERIDDSSPESEFSARLSAARNAAAMAWGVNADQVMVVNLDPETGAASVRATTGSASSIQTERRGDFVWAWALMTEV